jgi:hypothetical protein
MANWKTDGNATGAGDFLGTTNNEPLIVQTNGAERLRVLADGKVGLGLAAPVAELHVQGRIASGLDNSVAGTLSLLSPDAFAAFHLENGPAGGRPAGRLRFLQGGLPGAGEVMTLLEDGNVGIGLTAPTVKLHVAGGRIRLESGGRRLDLRSDGAHVDVQTETSDLYLHSLGPAGRNNLILNPFGPSGNVGIGLVAPQVKFHVAGNRIRLESGGRRLDLRSDGAHVDVQTETSDLYLHSLGPRGRNNVIINPFGPSGNVAIGTTAPQVRLHVIGNRVRLESGGRANRQLDLRSDGAHVDVETRTSDLYLHSLGPQGRNNVIINPFGPSGNVGVGTTAPTDKLHVIGNVRANDFIVTSDARLKRGIRPLRGALARLRQLRGVEYEWRRAGGGQSEPAAGRRLGLVAQEVEAVAPELVHEAAGDGMRGVNLGGLLATLVEATKELAEENARLRRRVETLEEAAPAGAA